MNTDNIIRLLTNSGFRVLNVDESTLYLEDPSCILRGFETFIDYAWIAIICITGMLLFGWAISMIRGVKNDIFTNLRSLIIIFGTLSAVGPIVNLIWGDDLFARGCRTIEVPISEVNRLLDAKKLELSKRNDEIIDIYDSGVPENADTRLPHEIPYSQAPITVPDVPQQINVAVSDETTNKPSTASNSDTATKAKGDKNDVVYTRKDGGTYRKTGGTRAWRNNNPGNLKYYDFAKRMGAIGQAGGFAVFPDEETGRRAMQSLLRTESYRNLSIANAISKYAPSSDGNDVQKYRQRIKNMTGLQIDRKLKDLNDEELARVARAIEQIEGWRVGKTLNN